ncbi:MAG: flagellar M-ring protein FliF [Acidobacteria bacterium]|nr:flagellar M-ring protein FliF [Acidobacteriota bacterium]
MEQLRRLLASLSLSQKITIVLVALAVAAGVWSLAQWRRESDFRPLYTGMAPEDAGAVVQKLKESGVEYRLSESGSTVLVPSASLAEMRIEMAAAGLPKSGRIGYEIFDKANFGATEFVEHINYRRALEGELERSIMAMAEVESARVHITFTKDSVFLEARQPAKASVMLRLRPGVHLPQPSVVAINHLVASAVEGLSPDAVSVLDMRGNLLSRGRRQGHLDTGEPSEEMLDFRRSVERDLVSKINTTLEPLLGEGKFRGGAFAECDFSSSEQSEENFDPNRSATLSSQRTEDIGGAGASNGVPGTPSNLPRPASRPGTSLAGVSRKSEAFTYQPSRVVRKTKLPQGSVKRISLAVLLDHDVRWEGAGASRKRVLVAPSPERMKVIRDLVAAATGFSAQRGDQLIVESLPFESTLNFEPPGPGSPAGPAPGKGNWLEELKQNRTLVMIVAGAVAGLMLLLRLLFWLVFRKRKTAVTATVPGELPAGAAESEQSQVSASQAAVNEEVTNFKAQLLAAPAPAKAELLSKEVRATVGRDSAAAAQNVRRWLAEETR